MVGTTVKNCKDKKVRKKETESDQYVHVMPVRRLICAAKEVKLGQKSHHHVGLSPFNFKQWNYICFSFTFPSSVFLSFYTICLLQSSRC